MSAFFSQTPCNLPAFSADPSPRSPSNSRWSKKQPEDSVSPTDQGAGTLPDEPTEPKGTPNEALEASEIGNSPSSTDPAKPDQEQSLVEVGKEVEVLKPEGQAAAEKLAAPAVQLKDVAEEAAEEVGEGKEVAPSSPAVHVGEPRVEQDVTGKAVSHESSAEKAIHDSANT